MKRFGADSWPRATPGVAGLALVLAVGLAGCSSSLNPDGSLVAGTVVDRYKVAGLADCPDDRDPTCDESLRLATEIVTGNRGVPADSIVGHRFYYEFLPPGMSRGGPPVVVVVFDLADG